MKTVRVTAALLVVLLAAGNALAGGFAVWEMGTKSSSMGGVMTATADDPTAIFYNPAGIVGLTGQNLTLDLTGIKPYTEFSGWGDAGADDVGSGYGINERMADNLFLLPQIYFTKSMNEKMSLGLGFYTPYGLAVEWDNPTEFSGRHISTFTDLKTFFVTPTLGYKMTDNVSIGFGLNVVMGHVELNQNVIGEYDDGSGVFLHDIGTAEVTGTSGLSMGYNLGLLADLGGASFGFSYKSGIDLEFDGDAVFEAHEGYEALIPEDGPASTAIPLPALFSVGVAKQLTEELLFEFNYNWIQWSAFDTLTLEFEDEGVPDKAIPEDYENAKQLRFGLEYQYNDQVALRSGFVMDETPQPEASCGPVLPDANRKGFSIGAGYQLYPNMSVDFYTLLLFLEDREIRDNHDGYNGDYRSFSSLFGVGFNYNF